MPLRSIIEEQINSNDFDLDIIAFSRCKDVLTGMRNNKFQIIYVSAEQALSRDFLEILRDETSALSKSLSLIVIDAVETPLLPLLPKHSGES